MARHKDEDWNLPEMSSHSHSWGSIHTAVFMDIRDELKTLNRVFACRNVQEGFSALRRIAKLNETDFKRRVDSAVRKRLARRK